MGLQTLPIVLIALCAVIIAIGMMSMISIAVKRQTRSTPVYGA
jgi:hypothetical protein